MKFRPFEEETIVSALTQEEIVSQVSKFTYDITSGQVPKTHIFNGNIAQNAFRISLKVNFPQNALPLAIGKIEPTSKGAIVFIKYQLFPATKVMLSVISGIIATICVTFLLIYMENEQIKFLRAIAITMATGIFYYMTLILNFFKRKNQTRSTLEHILNG